MNNPNLKRRDFLKVTWFALATIILKACSSIGIEIKDNITQSTAADIRVIPTETPKNEPIENQAPIDTTTSTPSSSPIKNIPEGSAAVALVNTESRSDGTQKALELLGINPVAGKSVFIKPNFNSSDPAPGSTHPDILRSMITQLQKMGAEKITIGDRSGMGNTAKVMKKLGVFDISEQLGIEVIVFDDLKAQDWEVFTLQDSNWSQGIPFARPALQSDVIVEVCCIKTHRYGGHFTMSLKNSVGFVAKTIPGNKHNFMTELHSSPNQRKMIAEINQLYTPDLILLDGVQSFTNGGPATGKTVDSKIILASTDRIAIDAVGVAVLRKFGTTKSVSQGPIFDLEQIAHAVELGIGIDSPEKIAFLTDSEQSEQYAQELREFLSI